MFKHHFLRKVEQVEIKAQHQWKSIQSPKAGKEKERIRERVKEKVMVAGDHGRQVRSKKVLAMAANQEERTKESKKERITKENHMAKIKEKETNKQRAARATAICAVFVAVLVIGETNVLNVLKKFQWFGCH